MNRCTRFLLLPKHLNISVFRGNATAADKNMDKKTVVSESTPAGKISEFYFVRFHNWGNRQLGSSSILKAQGEAGIRT